MVCHRPLVRQANDRVDRCLWGLDQVKAALAWAAEMSVGWQPVDLELHLVPGSDWEPELALGQEWEHSLAKFQPDEPFLE
jgi:hypothetical protein